MILLFLRLNLISHYLTFKHCSKLTISISNSRSVRIHSIRRFYRLYRTTIYSTYDAFNLFLSLIHGCLVKWQIFDCLPYLGVHLEKLAFCRFARWSWFICLLVTVRMKTKVLLTFSVFEIDFCSIKNGIKYCIGVVAYMDEMMYVFVINESVLLHMKEKNVCCICRGIVPDNAILHG